MRQSMMLEAPLSEYEGRIQRLTEEMKKNDLDGILLSAPDNMRYFVGHRSIVWVSNVSMPGTLVVSADGRMRFAGSRGNYPAAFATSCVEEDSFIPYPVEGARTYAQAMLKAFADLGLMNGRIGMEWGRGCRVRMIQADYETILAGMPNATFTDAADVIWALRGVKSEYEQEMMRKVNNINAKLFEHAFQRIVPGVTTERQLYNSIAAEAYNLGCDGILEMDVRGNNCRYGQGNCPPSDMPISSESGTVMFMDGGPSYQGYFSDIIRIGIIGKPTDTQVDMYKRIHEIHAAGMSKVRAGVPIREVVNTVDSTFDKLGVGEFNKSRGWIGHSLGLNVHEYPCLEATDDTPLKAGMVMTMEPILSHPSFGSMMFEQNFIVTETGYELISNTPTEMVILH